MAEKAEFVIENGITIRKYGDKGGNARWENSHAHELQQRLEPKYKAWGKEKLGLDETTRIAKAQLEFNEAREVSERTLRKWMRAWDKEIASTSLPKLPTD